MRKIKKWFSLIEVIIATSILSISIFWVYKLISENTKIINKSSNNIQLNNILHTVTECIVNIWFWNFSPVIWTEYTFNLWINNDKCNTWSVDLVNIDNINYDIKWIIIDSGNNYINWKISINDLEAKTLTWTFILLKN
jgi:prepilin-type N-terminal cleavage/methylation domain-containing protein